MTEPYLQLVGITKRYPGVQALSDVSFDVAAGEIVGLIGENGAGKSTLMKVLGGVIEPSAGVIRIAGVERKALTVNDAIAAGIAFVHQELNLFDNLDVAGNVFIGREPLTGGPLKLIDRRRLHEAVRPLLNRLGCDFGPETPLVALSLAQRQLVEIAKALSLDARVVIMDEPTSSLTISETRRLLGVVRDLKASGVTVVFISHRLREIEESADRVVVLRDGRVAGRLDRAEIKHDAMIRLMIGRDLKALYTPPRAAAGETMLELVDVTTAAHSGTKVNLAVRAGEILGLSGLVGAGRTELARAVFGIDALVGGRVNLAGAPVLGARWSARRRALLLASRVGVTQALMRWVETAEVKPRTWIQASAIGYYGVRPADERLDEDSRAGSGFMSALCRQWEQSAQPLERHGVRTVVLRLGIVFGPGGALRPMLLPHYVGLGGRFGDGAQVMSWIHRDDVLRIIARAMSNGGMRGVYNAVAPVALTQREFVQVVAKVLRRPAWLHVPAAPLRLAMGEMAELLLDGQRVMSARLHSARVRLLDLYGSDA